MKEKLKGKEVVDLMTVFSQLDGNEQSRVLAYGKVLKTLEGLNIEKRFNAQTWDSTPSEIQYLVVLLSERLTNANAAYTNLLTHPSKKGSAK